MDTEDNALQSRSAQKREADEIYELAQEIVGLTKTQLTKVPLDEDVLRQVRQCHKVTSHIAHRREVMFLAKQLRRRDDELEAIRNAVNAPKQERQRETAALHRLEDWRSRLMEEGDSALEALIAAHPHVDRQGLRTLVRNARDDERLNRNRGHYRGLFQELKLLFGASDDQATLS